MISTILDQIPISWVLKEIGLLQRFSILYVSVLVSTQMKITVKNELIGKAHANSVIYPY